jgi:hypothetical protein
MTNSTTGLPVALPVGRHALGSYAQYDQAQAVVDHLSDSGFPVETVTIVGADLRLVERVTGRLTRGRAALAGAASTAWLGLLFGLLLGLFAESGTALIGLVLYAIVFGAIFGAVLGFAAHAATGGRRDFSSMTNLAATRYEVLVEQSQAPEAERLLAQLPH